MSILSPADIHYRASVVKRPRQQLNPKFGASGVPVAPAQPHLNQMLATDFKRDNASTAQHYVNHLASMASLYPETYRTQLIDALADPTHGVQMPELQSILIKAVETPAQPDTGKYKNLAAKLIGDIENSNLKAAYLIFFLSDNHALQHTPKTFSKSTPDQVGGQALLERAAVSTYYIDHDKPEAKDKVLQRAVREHFFRQHYRNNPGLLKHAGL